MNAIRRLATDERGLMGKLLILWIVLGVLFALAAYDAGQIMYARFKVTDAAQAASFDAASRYQQTKDGVVACQAALADVEQRYPGAKMRGCSIDPATGRVTVTVTRTAPTLLAHRLAFLRHLTRAKATDTSEPPAL